MANADVQQMTNNNEVESGRSQSARRVNLQEAK